MSATFSSKPYFYDVSKHHGKGDAALQDEEGSSFLSQAAQGAQSKRVSYFFPKTIGEHHFGVDSFPLLLVILLAND